ncbi:hypothetical protein AB7942_30210 [Neobacillus sp. BF23-41]|uniref:hypothetical protein n=1 Tax=Neobacillus sp. BF23-41 TaxID=3240280 RepID=UPI0034E4AB8C
MNVTIEIHYEAASKLMQRASFPTRGRKPEQVALDFWKEIKKELSYRVELEQVFAGGEDITELVKRLERHELHNVFNDNLPF